MKKGFTLVELLAVIAILAVLAVITLPIITKTIEKSKKDLFQDNVVNLIKAIQLRDAENGLYGNKLYTLTNGVLSENLEVGGKIEGNGYVVINGDGEARAEIENDQYCVTKEFSQKGTTSKKGKCNSLGSYALDGLVLWYDGEHNLDFENHSTNSSVWTDLTKNGNDATIPACITNGSNAGTGWRTKNLTIANGHNCGAIEQKTGFSGMTDFSISLSGNFNQGDGSADHYVRIVSTAGGFTGQYGAINGVDLTFSKSSTNMFGYASNGNNSNYSSYTGLSLGKSTVTIVWNSTTKKLKVYQNERPIQELSITKFTNVNFARIGMAAQHNTGVGLFEYYGLRVYNRAISEDEVKQNYRVDQVRFGV